MTQEDKVGAEPVLCIGGGPAGLTAAFLLAEAGWPVTVLESNARYVGGISRTEVHAGYRFDIGGHRFFSKSAEVRALWQRMLGDAFVVRQRKSRIFYAGKFYPYPLNARATLANLGLVEASLSMLSYLRARLFPIARPASFEDWVSNQFGARLYRIFFKTYTEKVWGMPCSRISADWAAQRIRGLSLGKAVRDALLGGQRTKGQGTVKTLIQEFHYPRLGPGMMWEEAAASITAYGGQVRLDAHVVGLRFLGEGEARWEVTYRRGDGGEQRATARHVITSMPLSELVPSILPALPVKVQEAARALRYRDFIVVGLMAREGTASFEDQWIYVHEPGLKVGRIQNFKSWSPEMVPPEARVAGMTCYGMEYFCFQGDGMWDSADDALIALATRELAQLGLAAVSDVQGGVVIRQPKAYPVYDEDYRTHVETIRAALREHCPGLHTVGRNGMHKYNNQDHAMMTAMLTVRNLLEGREHYDIWQVNEDAEYHEADETAGGLRAVPRPLP